MLNNRLLAILLPALLTAALLSACTPATPQSTLTPLPAPTETATATHTQIPTPTAEVGINMEKLNNFPPSFEYFTTHPDEYLEAPDPLGTGPGEGPEAFQAWFDHLTTLLGDEKQLPATAYFVGTILNTGNVTDAIMALHEPVARLPYFMYFSHGGKPYSILGMTTKIENDRNNGWGTYFVIMDQSGYLAGDGVSAIENIKNGHYLSSIILLRRDSTESPISDPTTRDLVNSPYNWANVGTPGQWYSIGVGGFVTLQP